MCGKEDRVIQSAFRNYGLSLVLAGLFLASWLVQSVAGWVEFVSEQAEHQQAASLFGDAGYVWTWLQATFENWQSEFLQLFAFVVLTTFLIHRHSHESRDSQDEMAREIREIRDLLKTREES
jgi:uncharacterized protein DUF6766